MNIGAINTQIQLKNYIGLAKTASFKSLNSVDTFEKTTVPKSSNEAINWLEQTDFINTRLSETLNNDDNISGEGFSHIVYAIPGNEEYILRMKKSNVLKGQIKSSEIKDVEDKNLKVNIGQPVAEIVYETEDSPVQGRIEVLKKQTGEPVGVKPPSAIYIEDTDKLRENELPYEDISRKEAYARTIHKVAELPVEAYEKFLEDITSASKSGYKFDYYNSNNILVDDKGQALNLIDMDKCSMDADYGSILYALTNIEYFNTFTSRYEAPVMSDEQKMAAIDDTITIIDKYIQAMKNKGIKFDKDNSSMYFYKLLGSMPFQFFCKSFDSNEQWLKHEQMGVA